MNTRKILTFFAVFGALGLWATDASARAKGPLEGEPVVRNKLQLRRFRVQITPMVAMSLSQPFVHMGYVGGKLTFHFADWIGIRGTFGYGVVPVESQLLKNANEGGLPQGVEACPDGGSPPCRSQGDRSNLAPLRHDFQAGLVRAQWQSSFDVVFTPFAGKMGLFSGIFTEYDIYVFVGLGLVGYQRHYPNQASTSEINGLVTDPSSNNYCQNDDSSVNAECLLHPVSPDTGVKIGGSFGVGLNLMLVDWLALNLEVQDVVVGVNHTGLNATVEVIPLVDRQDRNAFHNVTLQVGARFYLPPRAKRTK